MTCLPKKTEETNERLVLPKLVTNMSTAWNKRIILIDEENPDNNSTLKGNNKLFPIDHSAIGRQQQK